MCPRTRSISNATIGDHACQLLIERGADAVTFAEVAKRCGLAPPTLVQRFASRQGMLEAAAASLQTRVSQVFGSADRMETPLANLLLCLRHLAPVQAAALTVAPVIELAAYSLELRKQISFALVSAIGAGQLPHCDVPQLARSIQLSFAGAVAVAELERRSAADEVASAVDLQLANYI
jgi:AcrR family transcriptional regulator